MTRVEIEIDIDRPSDEVFAYLADPENNPSWQDGMQSAVVTSDGPLAVGSTYEQIATFMGKDVISAFVVTGFQPGRSISIETTASTFPIQVTRAVRPNGEGGSLVRAVIEGQPTGLMRLFAPLLDRFVARTVRADYANLKRMMEAGEA